MPALLLQIILVLGVAGILLWGFSQIPMDSAIKDMVRTLIIVVIAIWALYLLVGLIGGTGGGGLFPYPRR